MSDLMSAAMGRFPYYSMGGGSIWLKKSFCTEKRPLSYGEVWAVYMGGYVKRHNVTDTAVGVKPRIP